MEIIYPSLGLLNVQFFFLFFFFALEYDTTYILHGTYTRGARAFQEPLQKAGCDDADATAIACAPTLWPVFIHLQ